MKKLHAILIAIIFLAVLAFFLLQPKPAVPAQNFNFYNIPILAAILIWVCLKVWGLLKKHKKLNS